MTARATEEGVYWLPVIVVVPDIKRGLSVDAPAAIVAELESRFPGYNFTAALHRSLPDGIQFEITHTPTRFLTRDLQ